MFDVILVPEGMEERVVRGAVRREKAESRIQVAALGLGAERTTTSLARLLATRRIERALVTGVCGLLAAPFRAGDLLLYESARDERESGAALSTDTLLNAQLAACVPQVKSGIHALACRSVVTKAREKKLLGERCAAQAVDMESYAALKALQNMGARAAVLRVASDAVHEDLPDLNAAIGKNGTLNTAALTREMLRAPRAGIMMALNGMLALKRLEHTIRLIAAQ